MSDDTQATDTTSLSEPTVSGNATAIDETPAQESRKKKAGRDVKSTKSARVAKTPKAAKATGARKTGKTGETPTPQEAPEPKAVERRPVRTAKAAKPSKTKKVEAKTVEAAKTARRAKPAKAVEAAPNSASRAKAAKAASKASKAAKAASKGAKVAPAKAAGKAAPVVAKGRDRGARHTTNELSSAVRKAGLIIEFTPVVAKPANIGRGPAKEFKVDAIVARLRGSNGELISERGPGTPFYNDAESLAAVEIFEKFRGRTFHNKLKVELL